VLAVADGEVVVAGMDHSTEYGWGLDYYGNLVVIKHDLPGIALPIYTLYGHLSRVNVEVGDKVSSGDVLGEVGSTGTAQGAHLHFEVRQGGNTYWDTRNPELWLKPCSNCGILLGTILDAQNQVKRFPDIKLEKLDHETPGKPVYLDSYDDPALKGDDVFQEIFAIGDLPAGEYQITFSPYGAAQRIRVQVLPGQITKITLHTH
jgi:murein DD-endopeptidase MepM/ murein hydrolase activator NlpD